MKLPDLDYDYGFKMIVLPVAWGWVLIQFLRWCGVEI